MSLADVCLVGIALGMTAYVVLGGADFGGGFWDLTAGGAERGRPLRELVRHSMGPVWETNHVWLIFVLVLAWTAFPVAFGSAMSTLYVAGFLAVAGIVLRGTAFALRGQASSRPEARLLGTAFALSSVLAPFCLGAAAGGIASGRVPVGNAAGDPWASWLNPASLLIGVLAVLLSAFLAAVFLAADADRVGLLELRRAFRARALATGCVVGAIAIGGLLVLRSDARALFDGLTSGRALICVVLSALAGLATLALVWRGRFAAARYVAAVAVAAITAGWALAQYPQLLPGELTVAQAAAPDATLVALLVSAALGALTIAPAQLVLYRMSVTGRLSGRSETS
jgi:cytochrome d ubiquinol oxidase subunit II